MKPSFQMPFMCNQKWRASTYDGHAPDQDSIDLGSSRVLTQDSPFMLRPLGRSRKRTTQTPRTHPTEVLSS